MNAVLLADDPAIADVQAARLAYSMAIEHAITDAARELAEAANRPAKDRAWTRLQWLHGQRLPAQVEAMERQKGMR